MNNVTVCCYVPFSSTNFEDENRVTGGMNGCGMKTVNFNSSRFEIETANKKLVFHQFFLNGADVISEPVIKEYQG